MSILEKAKAAAKKIRTPLEAWEAAVAEVSAAWAHHATAARACGGEPVWLYDEALSAVVGDALRGFDRREAHLAIGKWRRAWLSMILHTHESSESDWKKK